MVSNRKHLLALIKRDQEHAAELRRTDREAIDKAFDAATKLSESHNDLLRKMEKQSETFATNASVDRRVGRVENFQAKIAGGLAVLGAIGLGNFVKLWFG